MPNEDPFDIPRSSDARYWRLVELPKSHVLALEPSFTAFDLNPPIPAVTHMLGSFEYTVRRRCAPSDVAHIIAMNNATEKRLIVLLQVVLRFARGVG